MGISKHNVQPIASLAMFRGSNQDEDLMEEGDDKEPSWAPAIPIPILWIENANLQDTLAQVSQLRTRPRHPTQCTINPTRKLD